MRPEAQPAVRTKYPGSPQMTACGTWVVECVLCGGLITAHLRATVIRVLEEHMSEEHSEEVGH